MFGRSVYNQPWGKRKAFSLYSRVIKPIWKSHTIYCWQNEEIGRKSTIKNKKQTNKKKKMNKLVTNTRKRGSVCRNDCEVTRRRCQMCDSSVRIQV